MLSGGTRIGLVSPMIPARSQRRDIIAERPLLCPVAHTARSPRHRVRRSARARLIGGRSESGSDAKSSAHVPLSAYSVSRNQSPIPAPAHSAITGDDAAFPQLVIALEIAVNAIRQDDGDAARSERAIQSLANASDTSPEEVRALFTIEFSRLERVAKVRKYLHVLTTANVRAMLSRARVLRPD